MKTLYASFVVEDRFLGVPAARVQEVMRAHPLTPVPLAHAHVAGLVNLRGQIVMAIDLRGRLGLPARDPAAPSANVVVRTEKGPRSLVVDRLGDVVAVEDDRFEPTPDTVDQATRRLIKGVYQLDDALLLHLDLDQTVDLTSDRETV